MAMFLAIHIISNQSIFCQDKPVHPIDIRLQKCFDTDSIQSNSSMCDCYYEGNWIRVERQNLKSNKPYGKSSVLKSKIFILI